MLASFYLHLERTCHEIPIHVAPGKMMAEAIVLAEESFRNEGGMDALQAEARDATRGGLRFVLDQLAAEYRRKHQLMHANSVLTQALSSRPFEARVAFVRALMGRLGPLLPDELRMLPAGPVSSRPSCPTPTRMLRRRWSFSMMNSRAPDLEHLLACLRRDIDDAVLSATIDDPIDTAVGGAIGSGDDSGEFSIEAFHAAVSRVVQRTYEQALLAPRRLTEEQALACGFDWLEKHYVSRETRGYAAAMLDAMEEPWDGILLVCRALAEAMKQEIRRQMVAGELVRLLAPFGWSDRVNLVRECITRLGLVLPEQLRTLPSAQLVDELPGLILLVFSAKQPLLPRALA